MEKRFVIFERINKVYFVGASPRPNWGKIKEAILFNTLQEAEKRLDEENKLFPIGFFNSIIQILPIYINLT